MLPVSVLLLDVPTSAPAANVVAARCCYREDQPAKPGCFVQGQNLR